MTAPKAKPEPIPMVLVPAPLLTRACQLLGELPAKHSAEVYVQLRECEVLESPAEKPVRRASKPKDAD